MNCRPSDRLRRELDLAERLGLSRSSLREAVRAPSLVHILDVRQGDGACVTRLQPGQLMEALGFIVDYHRDDNVLLFLEVRRILEPTATAMHATSMPDEDVVRLGGLLDQLGDKRSVADLVANDLEFHKRIAGGSGNPVLSSLVESLSGPTRRASSSGFGKSLPDSAT